MLRAQVRDARYSLWLTELTVLSTYQLHCVYVSLAYFIEGFTSVDREASFVSQPSIRLSPRVLVLLFMMWQDYGQGQALQINESLRIFNFLSWEFFTFNFLKFALLCLPRVCTNFLVRFDRLSTII